MQRTLRMPVDEERSLCPVVKYELRGAVLCGYNFRVDPENLVVEMVVEDHSWISGLPIYRAGQATYLTAWRSGDEETDDRTIDPWAIADDFFNDAQDASAPPSGVLRKQDAKRVLELPEDPSMLSDVIIYLTFRKTGERLAFYRYKAADLCASSFSFAPRWITLQRTKPTKLLPGKPLPSILISVAFGKESESLDNARFPWPPPLTLMPLRSDLKAYELRAHLFQASALPHTVSPTLISDTDH